MPTTIKIVAADRPDSKDEEAFWVSHIAKCLGEYRGAAFLNGEFVECDSCASKGGSPSLCAGCLANRYVIGLLTKR